MSLLSTGNRLIVGLVVSVLLLILVLGFIIGLTFQIAPVPVNTSTQRIEAAGWEGAGATGGVVPGELLDDDEYIASWSPDLVGQRITFQGAKRNVHGFPFACGVDATRYELYLNTGGGWNEILFQEVGPSSYVQFGEWQAHASENWDIKAQAALPVPDGSGIRSVFAIHCFAGGWYAIAIDEARIEGGIGSVDWARNQYTVGEVAEVRWEIPYVTDDASGRGWSLIVEATASSRVTGPITLRQLVGTFRYNVTAADFETVAGCRNELVAHLRNELWGKDFDTATVIDATGAGPSVSDLAYSPRSPIVGDSIRLTWDAEPNTDTQLAIEKVIVKYGFGGIDKEAELAGEAESYVITAGSNGRLHVEVIAYDSGCRPSPTAELDINVGEEPPLGISFLVLLLLAIAGIAGLVLIWVLKAAPITIRAVAGLVPLVPVLVLVAGGFVR